MLSFCGITIGHIIGIKIRVDATLRLGHEALSEGHQGQMIDLRFPANLSLAARCILVIYHLQ